MNQEQAIYFLSKHDNLKTDDERKVLDTTFNAYRRAMDALKSELNSIGTTDSDHLTQLKTTADEKRGLWYHARATVATQVLLRDMERERKERQAQKLDTQRMTWDPYKRFGKSMNGLTIGDVL